MMMLATRDMDDRSSGGVPKEPEDMTQANAEIRWAGAGVCQADGRE